jgi:hypothetical protein
VVVFFTARNAEVRKVVGFFYREERGGAQGGFFLPRGTRRCAMWWVSFTARNARVRKVVGFIYREERGGAQGGV